MVIPLLEHKWLFLQNMQNKSDYSRIKISPAYETQNITKLHLADAYVLKMH